MTILTRTPPVVREERTSRGELTLPGERGSGGERTLPGQRGSGGERTERTERPLATPSLFDDLGGEPTLAELIAGVWVGLAAHRSVPCPACGAELKPSYGAQSRPVGGRCTSCGTALH